MLVNHCVLKFSSGSRDARRQKVQRTAHKKKGLYLVTIKERCYVKVSGVMMDQNEVSSDRKLFVRRHLDVWAEFLLKRERFFRHPVYVQLNKNWIFNNYIYVLS